MFNLTRKGLWAHKVRFLLTGLAVILGVSFMAGTMILTDTMGKTFDGLFATSNEGIDVVVHRTTGVDSSGGIDVQVIAPGGTQRVEWRDDGVFLTGWADLVFEGTWLAGNNVK